MTTSESVRFSVVVLCFNEEQALPILLEQLISALQQVTSGISTDSRRAANIERGFCPQNRSAAVVPSGRVRKKLWMVVRQARFRG